MKSDEEILSEAVREAKERFNEVIEEEGGLDPAYFSIDLQGYLLSSNFKKYRHSVEMYDQEAKEIEDE